MSNAVVGALRVDLGLDSSAFSAGLQNARNSLKGVGQSMQQIGGQMTAAVSAPLVGIGALTLKTAGDFEASMNRVRAALGATDDEFKALGEAARDMGATTQFSASEAANAIEILAKNGVNSADILGGALDAALTLAASSSSDMGSAADVATDVMANFGKEAADLGGVVDGITGVLLQSKFGFDDYRLAIGQAGGVAGQLGVELEEFNSVIAATSSSFASGSDAGTSFKTFLQRLVPSSKEAAALMDQLNIEFFDASGNMKGMAEVAQELQDGVAGLNEEARNDALSTMFGQDAIRTALALAREGAAGIDELTESISRASATEQAEARMEGLNGTLKALRSAVEELMLVIADSGLLETFTNMVEGAVGLARAAGELNPKIVQLGVAFAAIAAAMGPFLIGGGLIIAAAGGPAFIIAAAVAGLTAAAIAFSPELIKAKDAIVKFGSGVKETISNLSDLIVDVFAGLPAKMTQIGSDIISGLYQGILNKYEAIKGSIAGVANSVTGVFKGIFKTQSPSKVFKEIGGWLMDGLRLGIDGGAGAVESAGESVADGLVDTFGGAFKSILFEGASFRDQLGGILGGIASGLFDEGWSALTDALPGYAYGTNNAPGGLAIVGERGPEVVNLPRGSQVIPNHKLPDQGNALDVTVTMDPSTGALGAFVRNEAGQVVAQAAPTIRDQSVGATRRAMNKSKAGWGIG